MPQQSHSPNIKWCLKQPNQKPHRIDLPLILDRRKAERKYRPHDLTSGDPDGRPDPRDDDLGGNHADDVADGPEGAEEVVLVAEQVQVFFHPGDVGIG